MTSTGALSMFAATAVTLYAAHHVGDYWVQTDHQAKHKGMPGHEGALACYLHVATYVMTQVLFLALLWLVAGAPIGANWAVVTGLTVSGVTHYTADRREYGLMFWLARKIPGKAVFMRLGVPREPSVVDAWFDCASCEGRGTGGQASFPETNGLCADCQGGGKLPSSLVISDNPSLGTGTWALDQSWHIFWGVFVPALIIAVSVR